MDIGACLAHALPPKGSRFFHFDIQNFQNLTALGVNSPLWGWFPPMGNFGSATDYEHISMIFIYIIHIIKVKEWKKLELKQNITTKSFVSFCFLIRTKNCEGLYSLLSAGTCAMWGCVILTCGFDLNAKQEKTQYPVKGLFIQVVVTGALHCKPL